MDTSVALVQAYLHVNGYFTVAEYPVLEAYRGTPAVEHGHDHQNPPERSQRRQRQRSTGEVQLGDRVRAIKELA